MKLRLLSRFLMAGLVVFGGSFSATVVSLAAQPTLAQVTERTAGPLLAEALRGPLRDVKEIVFAVRAPGRDGHYYANFGHYDRNPNQWVYGTVSYDGQTILFAYRPGGTHHYHLYEIGADGTGLRQITRGEWDDFEPIYLPDGDLVFCSSRCNRFVACWYTPVAVLYRSRADGSDARMLSSNIVHDNTPWMLPDGRILYTRWEYVDRSRVRYHHLWTINPDGAGQMVYFGNMHGDDVIVDAKPVPGSHSVVCIISPGHGRTEHAGRLVLIDPRSGPDERTRVRTLDARQNNRDPYPLSEDCHLVASGTKILLVNAQGQSEALYELPAGPGGLQVHEPRPLQPRAREPVIAARTDLAQATGRLVLADVLHGRNMPGVKPGEIRKLLVLEQLPKPVNLNGTTEHNTSIDGTFTLKRILGTVPVEADGSAYLEVPALRSLFFVALDENDLSVKRMQSFVTVQPGEVTGCVGCHEPRTRTFPAPRAATLAALCRPPSLIAPVVGVPSVIDFPRDVQPVLDRHCVRCHRPDKAEGQIDLSGGPGGLRVFSRAYRTLLTTKGLVSHGQDADGNRAPRTIGSSASRLMKLCDGSHYDARLSAQERNVVRLWIDAGAFYPGTCAAMAEETDTAFQSPMFRPNGHYIREMKGYGLLPAGFDAATTPLDVYALDEAYWRSFWWTPRRQRETVKDERRNAPENNVAESEAPGN
ncbi:MAG: hypothetical protein NTV46_05830 [Verrucomicrobia bacterium]|nr:hypothetical protein [Verrucomicrobiota bacterium]